MIQRNFWLSLVEKEWSRRPVLWLCGVRRVGKTFLCLSLPDVEYFDCELPRVRKQMSDPEEFLSSLKGKRVVLDEIHRLANPSELLKITADHFPTIKIMATGSSSLGASTRFQDTLTGRKSQVWLTPMNSKDLMDFGKENIPHRLLRGGLPPFFQSPDYPEKEFQEWLDSYWAKDIQELFRLERRSSFLKFMELLFIQSGGIFEATRFAAPCEIGRSTVSNYLSVLEATRVIYVIRPFSSRLQAEIISAPKTYAFDTGFVCYFRGWNTLRIDDMGILWEHFVLNEMYSMLQSPVLNYWRDKRGHEIDFVLNRRGKEPVAIECKWQADNFETTDLTAFRKRHPGNDNWVICHDVEKGFFKTMSGLHIRFCGLGELKTLIKVGG